MEVMSYISIGALAAVLFSKLVDVVQLWLSSPAVQQAVTMALMLRESMPLAVRSLGSSALTVLKPVFTGIVQVLHLLGHIIYQVALFARNIYAAVIATGKGLYVVLQTVNEGFAYVWNFSDNILTPFTNWMLRQPVRTGRWQTIMMILLLSFCISTFKKYMALKKRKTN
jgi:hypothetical protein